MSLITVNNLVLGYDGHPVTEAFSLNVEKGDYLCIIGQNGSGKSTFVKTLLGLQDRVSGEILFGEGLAPSEVGYLPQQTVIQKDFPASVTEIVLSGFQNISGGKFFYTKEEKKQAAANLERLGIAGLAKKCYRDLSGGQQQRVLLARALCASSKLMVLDEPVAGLDPEAQKDMYETVRELNQNGMTIIMVSHDMEAAFRYASHILYLGERLFFGTKEGFGATERGKKLVNGEGW